MTKSKKLPLTRFSGALILLSLLILWSAFSSWREAAQVQAKFSARQLESFKIADHLQEAILDLNTTLIRSEFRDDGLDAAEFDRASRELNLWIDEQKPRLSSSLERKLLDKIDRSYDDYLRTATNVFSGAAPARDGKAKLSEIEQTVKASITLLDLGYQLADAHRRALEMFFMASQKSVAFLQRLTFGSLALLLFFVFGAFAIDYRERITRLQLELVQSKTVIQRQEKLAALGVLAAGVAHEIRSPLTAIKARLFTLQKKLLPGASSYEDAELIRNEIHRLENLVKEVLLFARPAEPSLVAVEAEQPLREICQLMAPQLQKNGTELRFERADRAVIMADAHQLKQVLINLIQNAAESAPKDGLIALRCLSQKRTLKGVPAAVATFQIQDNGAGIPPEAQERLFDPFFTTKAHGTGLGLSIAARIVELHGGSLEFQTTPGVGTLFEVLLPLAQKQNRTENEPGQNTLN